MLHTYMLQIIFEGHYNKNNIHVSNYFYTKDNNNNCLYASTDIKHNSHHNVRY